MKNLFLSVIALSLMSLSCKKNDTTNNVPAPDSTATPGYSDSTGTMPDTLKDTLSGQDSINTKTHIGGRKTSNNNTGNGTGNINAAVSDSAHPTKTR
jgi:hypothetical protein